MRPLFGVHATPRPWTRIYDRILYTLRRTSRFIRMETSPKLPNRHDHSSEIGVKLTCHFRRQYKHDVTSKNSNHKPRTATRDRLRRRRRTTGRRQRFDHSYQTGRNAAVMSDELIESVLS